MRQAQRLDSLQTTDLELTVTELDRGVPLLQCFDAEYHGKGEGDGVIGDVKTYNKILLRKEERRTVDGEGDEYQSPQSAEEFTPVYKDHKMKGVLNKSFEKNTSSDWGIFMVPVGRVDYDSLLLAKTVNGCKGYSKGHIPNELNTHEGESHAHVVPAACGGGGMSDSHASRATLP